MTSIILTNRLRTKVEEKNQLLKIYCNDKSSSSNIFINQNICSQYYTEDLNAYKYINLF